MKRTTLSPNVLSRPGSNGAVYALIPSAPERGVPNPESPSGAPSQSMWFTRLDRDQMYMEFASLVKRLIREYGRDAEMRQDLAGEIYCQFCALLDVYDPQRGVPLRPYIVRQLTFAVHTYTRQQRRVRNREVAIGNIECDLHPATIEDPTPAWVQALSHQQVISALPNALACLPDRQRRVVIWRYYEERSFEEIAQLLNIQPATARSLLRHGLTHLRKHVAEIQR